MSERSSVEVIFKARSVAVVGASDNPDKLGYVVLRNILSGYEGKVYPVNPKHPRVQGLAAYPSLRDLPGPVELAVFAVPAPEVVKMVEDVGAAGGKGIVVISGGFREVGNHELENRLKHEVARAGLRMIGPNCQGFSYSPNGFCCTWPEVKTSGPLAVISQSGTIAATISLWSDEENVGTSAVVSLGNKVDVTETDLLEFFLNDPSTHVIAMYVEGIADGPRFLRLARDLRARGKRLVVLYPGRTDRGRAAAYSHTRTLASDARVMRALCRQVGAVCVATLQDFLDAIRAAVFCRPPLDNSLYVVTTSGGSGILATDAAVLCGFRMSDPVSDVGERLKGIVPPHATLGNPLDLTWVDAATYSKAVQAVVECSAAGTILVIIGDPIPGIADDLQALSLGRCNVVAAILGAGETGKEEGRKLQRAGVAVFPTPEQAAFGVSTLLSNASTDGGGPASASIPC